VRDHLKRVTIWVTLYFNRLSILERGVYCCLLVLDVGDIKEHSKERSTRSVDVKDSVTLAKLCLSLWGRDQNQEERPVGLIRVRACSP